MGAQPAGPRLRRKARGRHVGHVPKEAKTDDRSEGVALRDPFVSIVIPTKNVADIMPSCLASIAALDCPRDRYEVVADGRSSDETVQIASSAGARIVDDGGRGRTVAPRRA